VRAVWKLDLPARTVGALEARTEGWAVGLQLAALSLHRQPDPGAFLEAFSSTHRYVVDYLTEAVLDRQPDRVRRFLLHTSILERLTGPLCDAITGTADGQGLLEELERAPGGRRARRTLRPAASLQGRPVGQLSYQWHPELLDAELGARVLHRDGGLCGCWPENAGAGRRGAARAVNGLASSAEDPRRSWRAVPAAAYGPAGDAASQAPLVGVAAQLGQARLRHRDTQLVVIYPRPPLGCCCSGQHATDAPRVEHPPKGEYGVESACRRTAAQGFPQCARHGAPGPHKPLLGRPLQ
jgi:hypothetical protein